MMNSDFLGHTDWKPSRIISAVLVVLAVVFGFWVLFRYRLVVFSLFEAIVFSTAITPLVGWMHRRGIPKPVGVGLTFIGLFAAFIGIILVVSPMIGAEGTGISQTLASYYSDFRNQLLTSPSILLQRFGHRIPTSLLIEPSQPDSEGQTFERVNQALLFSSSILRGIFTTLIVLLLTLYWTLEKERIIRSGLLLVPLPYRDAARDFYEASEDRVGAYIRGLGFLSLAVGSMSIIAYMIVGIPYAFLLGVIAGIMEIIPLVGPILGAIPALLVALALSPEKVWWIVLATVIIQALENNLLVPKVMNKAVGVNPVVGLLAFLSFSDIFGLPGAILAIPIAVIIQMVLNRLFLNPDTLLVSQPTGRDPISVLRYEAVELVQDVRKQIRLKERAIDDTSDMVEDAIEEIANDLDTILGQVEENSDGKAPG